VCEVQGGGNADGRDRSSVRGGYWEVLRGKTPCRNRKEETAVDRSRQGSARLETKTSPGLIRREKCQGCSTRRERIKGFLKVAYAENVTDQHSLQEQPE